MLRFVVLFLLSTILFSCSKQEENFPNKDFTFKRDLRDSDIRSILYHKDHRNPDSLVAFLESEDPNIQYELALAAASIQDCNLSKKLLEKVYKTAEPSIRGMIYYAFGQSCRNKDSKELFELAKYEQDSLAQIQLAEAIAKSSVSEDIVKFMKVQKNFNDFAVARALYQFSQRNAFYDKSIDKMVSLLQHKSSKVRNTASNMLARLKGEDLVNYSEELFLSLNSDSSAGVRMNVATAFNKINGNRFGDALLTKALDSTEDFRVRVNAINSLNYYHYETYAPEIVTLLGSEKLNVQLEAAQFFLNRCKRNEWNEMARIKDDIDNPQVGALVLEILLKFAEKDQKKAVNSHILLNIKNNNDPFIKSFYIKALKSWPNNYMIVGNLIFDNKSLVVKSNAMQAFYELSKIDLFKKIDGFKNDASQEELIVYFSHVFKMAILSGDPTLIGYGAKGLRNEGVNFISKLENTDFIEVTMQNIPLPRDIETYIDLEKTLAFIEGEEMPNKKPPLNHFIDFEQLEAYNKFSSALITTNKGDFQIEFDNETAPTTVANFIELSQRDFYDSLRFHRVENNFVVQGGCPRGDGWGSSGESIRSEFGPKYYKTGSVGMASAGKDTESCQWFVTHYPSIHLDGSYTNFAKVTDGMDVVFQLSVGDSVLGIEILP